MFGTCSELCSCIKTLVLKGGIYNDDDQTFHYGPEVYRESVGYWCFTVLLQDSSTLFQPNTSSHSEEIFD